MVRDALGFLFTPSVGRRVFCVFFFIRMNGIVGQSYEEMPAACINNYSLLFVLGFFCFLCFFDVRNCVHSVIAHSYFNFFVAQFFLPPFLAFHTLIAVNKTKPPCPPTHPPLSFTLHSTTHLFTPCTLSLALSRSMDIHAEYSHLYWRVLADPKIAENSLKIAPPFSHTIYSISFRCTVHERALYFNSTFLCG